MATKSNPTKAPPAPAVARKNVSKDSGAMERALSTNDGQLRVPRQHLAAEEGLQLRTRLVRCFLGQIVAAGNGSTTHVVGPVTPDRQHVVPARQLSAAGPQDQHRAGNASRAAIGFVEGEIDSGRRPVVLTHGMDRGRVPDTAQVSGERLRMEDRAVTLEVEGVRIVADQALRKWSRLRQEEPVPVAEPEGRIRAAERFPGRDDVENGELGDSIRVIEGQPV